MRRSPATKRRRRAASGHWLSTAALDKRSRDPIYRQLQDVLRQWLSAADVRPGVPVPTEAELCKWLRVSRGTVRRALQSLTEEGLIQRRQGQGSFVVRPRVRQHLSRYVSFTESCRQRGIEPSSRVISLDTRRAFGAVARLLRVKAGERVVRLERLRCANGEPVCLDTVFIPARLCPDLARYDFARASLFQILAHEYGIMLSRASGWLRPELAQGQQARLLETLPGSPMLLLETTLSAQDGAPLVFSQELWRGDRTHYLLETTSPLTPAKQKPIPRR